MNLFAIAIVILCTVILGAVLKKTNPEHKIVLTLAAAAVVLMVVLDAMVPFIQTLQSFLDQTELQTEYLSIMVKATGIAILGQITSGICKDAGEQALEHVIEIASKLAMLLLALPIISQLFAFIKEILI